MFLALAVAAIVMITAAFLGSVAHFRGGKQLRRVSQIAAVGYAFPGTILAIGVVIVAGFFDSGIAALISTFGGRMQSGLMTRTVLLVVVACVVRFQAVGYGAVTSEIARLPGNMMAASRSLGRSFAGSLWEVILPLLKRALLAGGLLVFVDVMEELPMTLLLRPFNVDTLATYVYQFAKDELLEEAALPALLIIVAGLIPIILMNAALYRLTRR